ncbi:MAG: hypothetical protein IPI39_25115, partial [Candidatus Obscuribacter sp.]|nr:hypothetical protein [Candidatus Obscuribacter sp.]
RPTPAAASGLPDVPSPVPEATPRRTRPRGADLIISAGDNVYHHGRFNEYLSRFFPIYQAQTAHPDRRLPT